MPFIYSPYYYRIRDTETGMFYSGSKFGKDANPQTFWKDGGYFTSSPTIHKLIEQSGTSRFEVCKVVPMSNAYDFETRFLKKINAASHPMFYNGHNNNGEGLYGSGTFESNMLKKYGAKRAMHSKVLKEKHKKTMQEKHGVSYPVELEIARKNSKKSTLEMFEKGTHPFQDPEVQKRARSKSAERVSNGTHNFLNSDIQHKTTRRRVEKGTFNFNSDYAKQRELEKRLKNGPIIEEIKRLKKEKGVKLEKNWHHRDYETLCKIRNTLL